MGWRGRRRGFRKEAVFSIPVGGSTMEEGKSGRMVISMEPVAVQAARVQS